MNVVRPHPGLDVLHARLLAGESATAVIGDLFGRPVRVRRRHPDAVETGPRRHILHPADHELVLHRAVLLIAREQIISEADLYYVPSRLGPGMPETLRDTDTPFGTVARPLQPVRETHRAEIGAPGDPRALIHEALLTAAGLPIAFVSERYFSVQGGK